VTETTPCPFCQSRRNALVCTKKDRQERPVQILRCGDCDLLFGWPFPSEEDLRGLYTADYFQCDSPLQGGYEDYRRDEPEIKKTFLRRWPLLIKHLPQKSPGRVLDVGCATGVFLDVAQEEGAEPYGVELSAFGAAETQKKGIGVFQGELAAAPLEHESFDLVTLWDVIEHVRDPLPMLLRCHRLLKSGGILALTTPDASSQLARLLGSYWLGFRSVGEHLYFFGRKTIRAYLQKAGYEVLEMCAVGKYMKWDRLLRRLGYYTRIFDWLRGFPRLFGLGSYFNSGDTMYVIARKI